MPQDYEEASPREKAAASGQNYYHSVPLFPGSRQPFHFSSSFAKGSGYRLPSLIQMQFLTAALKALEPRIDDDFVDRMNYYYTSTLIIMFAILVSAKQYVGHPIECWVPAHFTKAMEQYTENYCWIQNTYWVPFNDPIPHRMDDRERRQIGYYQWVPFILALEALMFYVPASLWRILSGQSGINITGILQMSTDDRNIEPANRLHTVDILSRHIDDALRYQRDFGSKHKPVYLWSFVRVGKIYGAYVTTIFLVVKFLYLVNVLGQFWLLNKFLETADYPMFGAHVVWDLLSGIDWQYSGKFPRVTLCDFEIRTLGNIHRHTVQCVLVINMFTERIFIFLWLWFILLIVVNFFNCVFYLLTLLVPVLRIDFVHKCLELSDIPPDPLNDRKHLRRFVQHFLRPDGIFILRMVAAHSGTITSTELVYSLWLKYREAQKQPKVDHFTPTAVDVEEIDSPLKQTVLSAGSDQVQPRFGQRAMVLPKLSNHRSSLDAETQQQQNDDQASMILGMPQAVIHQPPLRGKKDSIVTISTTPDRSSAKYSPEMQPLTSGGGVAAVTAVDRKPSFTTFQKPTNLPLKRYSSPKAESRAPEEMDF